MAKVAGFEPAIAVLETVALDRSSGKSRAYVLDSVTIPEVQPILLANVQANSKLMTDEAHHYRSIGRFFYKHDMVHHGRGEYGRGDLHTNTIEGYFSIFKRGMKGVYQHCQKKHLHRYVAEFNFRYSNRVALGYNDTDRSDELLKGIVGKRLTYQRSHAGA